ncbi:MAG: cysteine-rich small domain-containing protein [Bilophila sp.]
MEHSSRFFQNTACAHFPCYPQANGEAFNRLFCYCPLYFLEERPGAPRWTSRGVKDCSACRFPHRPENDDAVIARLSAAIRDRAAKRAPEER